MKLLLDRGGRAALFEDDSEKELLWTSDNDPDFQAEFDDFLTPDDFDDILEYLVDEAYMDDDEANDCLLEEESLDGDAQPELIDPDAKIISADLDEED